jgi:hypothetical protein
MFQMQYSYFPVRGVELAARGEVHRAGRGDVLDRRHRGLDEVDEPSDPRAGLQVQAEGPHGDLHRRQRALLRRARRAEDDAGQRHPPPLEFIKECNQRVVDFCKGADLLVADSQYTDQEYETKRGWGHSSISHVLTLSKESSVKKLVLFHHEPHMTIKD